MNLSKNGHHPIGCVALFLFNENRELFIMERLVKTGFTDEEKAAGKKMLCIAGGKIDWGEQPVEAMVRETKEEIGIDLDSKNVAPTGLFSSDFWPHINVHTLTLYFAARLPEGQTPEIPLGEQKKMGNPQWVDMFNPPKLFCNCHLTLKKYLWDQGVFE
jgi:8-oxo-dGTP pyrophosphatase MutT (NUDIX family)